MQLGTMNFIWLEVRKGHVNVASLPEFDDASFTAGVRTGGGEFYRIYQDHTSLENKENIAELSWELLKSFKFFLQNQLEVPFFSASEILSCFVKLERTACLIKSDFTGCTPLKYHVWFDIAIYRYFSENCLPIQYIYIYIFINVQLYSIHIVT